MHIYPSRWLVRGESWFQWQEPAEHVDLVDFRQLPCPLPQAVCRPFYTYHVTLDAAPDAILSRFNQTTRREVRQARDKGEIICRVSVAPTEQEVETFIGAYAAFAAAKKRPPMNVARLRRFLADQSFWLSFAYSASGDLLVAHGNYIGHGRMRSSYAASPLRGQTDSKTRQLIGRAGRYLTWTDMMAARDAGLRIYDFGGWYPGTEDKERLAINAYKSGFGGVTVCEYHCQRAFSLKGHMAMGSCRALDWLRHVRLDRPTRLNLMVAGNWGASVILGESAWYANLILGEPSF
jgi:hypothetical protein